MNTECLTPTTSTKSFSLTQSRYYPWLVIALCSAFLVYKYILQVSPSIMTSQLMRVFHVDGAGLGNLTATYFYSYLLTQLFVGVLLDKFSSRLLMALAIALAGAGGLLFAYTPDLLYAELGRVLIGVGAAFATVGYMKMTAVWFSEKQFALVGGLLATAAMLGALFGEAPLSMLVNELGWREALTVCGLLGFVLSVLFYAVVREHNAKDSGVNELVPSLKPRDFLSVLQCRNNWLLMFYSGLAFSPVAVFGGLWGNPYLEKTFNLTSTHAASLTSLVFLGLALGGPVLGALSQKWFSQKYMMMLGTALSFVSLSLVLYMPGVQLWLVGVFLFLFGLGTGAFMLSFAMGRSLNPVFLAASVAALLNTGDAIFGALTDPLVGFFLDEGSHHKLVNGVPAFSTLDFQHAFVLLPLYLLLAMVVLSFVKTKHP